MNRKQFIVEFGQQLAIHVPDGAFQTLSDEDQQLARSGGIRFVRDSVRERADLGANPVLCFQIGGVLDTSEDDDRALLLFLDLLKRKDLVESLTRIEECVFVHTKAALSDYVGTVSAALLQALPASALQGFDESDDESGTRYETGLESTMFDEDLANALDEFLDGDSDTQASDWSAELLDCMTLRLFGDKGVNASLQIRVGDDDFMPLRTSASQAFSCGGTPNLFRTFLLALLDAGLIDDLTLKEGEYVIGDFENLYALALRSLSMHILVATEPEAAT